MAFQKAPATCPICREGKQFIFVRDFTKDSNEFSLYECVQCNVQFWLPLKTVDNIWYENNNPYQVRDLDKPGISRGYHKSFLNKYKKFATGTKVLDLGCGTGEFIAELEKRGCMVFGVDFDRDAIKIAKEKFNLKNIYALPFEDFFKKDDLPKFDIITFFEFLEHINNPLEFIQNVKKLLKPSGRIVFSTPSRERMMANLNSWDFPPHHATRWSQKSLEKFFTKQDLQIAKIDYVEQFKILSESVSGKFETGLVTKSLNRSNSDKKSLVVPKIIYLLGKIKSFLLGKIPASLLFLISKIAKQKNGIMLVELASGKKLKKIFLFTPSIEAGGMERVISDLSMNLPNTIEKNIVLFSEQSSYPYTLNGKITSLGLPSGSTLPLSICNFLLGIVRMRKLVKIEKPDYVISFGFHANIANVLSSNRSILRADTYLSVAHGYIGRILIKFFYSKARLIICVSKAVADDLEKNFMIKKDKIKVIYNFINTKSILDLTKEPIEKIYEDIFNGPAIINVGRLERQKGQQYLIKIFKEIKKEVKNARLIILGLGNMEEELKQMVNNFKLGESVYFLGWQKNPFKFLSRATVFASTSLREGLPCAILEAMACGLPIVSTDCRFGPREILAPNTDTLKQTTNIEEAEYGIITPILGSNAIAGSEQIFKKAIIRVLNDKKMATKLSEKSLYRSGDFDVSRIINQWDFLEKNE